MNPILFPKNQTSFISNGLGRLAEAVSCYVTEERNGQFELEMEYPETGRHYQELQEGMILYARHSDADDLQPFRIYRMTRPLNGIVTVYARHISYDLSDIVCRPFSASSAAQAMAGFSTHSINTNPFTFWTDKSTAASFSSDVPFSVRSMLGGTEGSILDVYGGEYEWDHYTVKLHEHRGTDRNVTIRYGKNLTDLTAESEITDPVTAVVPFWKQDDEIVILPEWAVGEDLSHLTVLDMTEMIQQKPAVEQLRDSAEGWLQNHSSTVPKRNIKISFVQLWQTEEYKDIAPLQRVWLCDTVTVLHEPLGVKITTKVIKTKYDCLLERYVEMELGDVKDDLLDILEDNVKDEIVSLKQSLPSRSYVDQAVEYATQMISGGLGGHVVFNLNADGEPQEILIMDTDNVETAVNVIRMNQNGIGFSTTGYNGPFTTAWTIDGHFNADFITAGTMNANRIKAGILSDEAGRNHWNLLTGEFSLQAGSTIGGETIDEKIDAANAYTDSQLAEFASTVNSSVANLQAQIDGQIETYYYDYEPTLNNQPASSWTTTDVMEAHEGDLFFWKSRGYAYRFMNESGTWKWKLVQDTDITLALANAAAAQDTADHKRRVFTSQPVTPYDAGDLWMQGASGDILTCTRTRVSGSYNASDWSKLNKYTDDSALTTFMNGSYASTINSIQGQIDQKIDTWYQTSDPSSAWSTSALKNEHKGDLWYNSTASVQKYYRWSGTAWQELTANPPSSVFNTIDTKRQIFVSQPAPPYAVGDLWVQGSTGDILRCSQARASGSYNANDWVKASKYTDDTAVENLQIGGENLLRWSDFSKCETIESNYNWESGGFGYSSGGNGTVSLSDAVDTPVPVAKVYRITGNTSGNRDIQQRYIPLEPNTDYTFSAWIRIMNGTTAKILSRFWDRGNGRAIGSVTEDLSGEGWIRWSSTKNTAGMNGTQMDFSLGVSGNSADIEICAPKLEKGSKATDWSLSVWDRKEELETMRSYVDAVTEDLGEQIDGVAEQWFYSGVPTASNLPASAWTTTDLKDRHVGDWYYDVKNGYAYRYTKSGSTYSWTKTNASGIQDALASASTAQDTADSKRRVFTAQPTAAQAYDAGDLWVQGASGDILKCVTAKAAGVAFSQSHWAKASKYTDDAALTTWVNGDFADTISDVRGEIDQKAETWYQSADPAASWTATEKAEHKGDLWYNTTAGKSYTYSGSGWIESDVPQGVYNKINGKAQIFTAQPAPPYNKGDLWFQSATSDIMTCVTSRTSGNYTASDWQKRNKYTDDSALNTWIAGDYAADILALENQIDGKVDTWYQTSDPSASWNTAALKTAHTGDLWYNSTGSVQKYYRWNGSSWQELTANPPAAVFNEISGKAQIFTGAATPTGAAEGDLWFKGVNEPILTFVNNAWTEYNKYTDDTAAAAIETSLGAGRGGDNMLFDVYTKAAAAINAPSKIYISDASNTGTGYQFIDAADLPDPNASCFLRFTANSGTGVRALAFYSNHNPPIQSGEYYRIGCYARSTTGNGHLRLRIASNTGTMKDFVVTSEWKWYEYITRFIDSGSTTNTYKRTYFYFRPTEQGESIDMCGFRLNQVTDYIQSMKIVNENLLPRTKDLAAWSRYSGVTIEKDPDEDVNVFHYPAVATAAYRDVHFNQPGIALPYALVRNQTVTVSYWIKMATPSAGVGNVGYAVFSLASSPSTGRIRYSSNQVPAYVLTDTSDWQKIVFTTTITDALFTSGSGTITDDLYFYIQFYNHSTSESWMKKPKLEFGGIDTEWCPNRYDDLPGGGRNLLKGSKLNIVNSTTYNIAVLYFGDQRPVEGETYVLQIKGTLGSDRVGWGIYNSGGTVYEGNYNADNNGASPAFFNPLTGIYTIIIPSWKIVQGSTTAANNRIGIYQLPKTGASSASSIEWVKLEKGTVPTDWTPAPEDVEEEIETAQESADTALSRFGTCTTAASTAAKAVTCPTFTLSTGSSISVLFTNSNTVASPTLNVNSTGAKTIKFKSPYTGNLESLTADSNFNWIANASVDFQYDGTYWVMMDSNSTLDQTRVFNALTKNQANQGLYLDSGNCYVNASYIKTGTLAADRIGAGSIKGNHIESGTITADKLDANVLTSGHIKLYGDMNVYKDETDLVSADNIGGRIGYAEGHDGTGVTRGVRMSNKSGSFYYIVTDSGVRMTANGANPKDMYVSGDGPVMRYDANRLISVTADGPTLKYQNTKLEVHHGTFVNVGSTQTSLGSNTYKWSAVYASTATIQSSDRKQKYNVSYDIERFVKIFDYLKPASFKRKDGQSGRTHLGMIAQDVEESMNDLGIDSMEFAAFIKEKVDGEYLYGLRYEEFIPILIAKVQKQQEQIDDLMERVSDLEKAVVELYR